MSSHASHVSRDASEAKRPLVLQKKHPLRCSGRLSNDNTSAVRRWTRFTLCRLYLTEPMSLQFCCTCKGRRARPPEVRMVLKLVRVRVPRGGASEAVRGRWRCLRGQGQSSPAQPPFCSLYLHYCSSLEATGCCWRRNGA